MSVSLYAHDCFYLYSCKRYSRQKRDFFYKKREINLFLITRHLLFSETLCLILRQRNRFRLHMLLQILQKR